MGKVTITVEIDDADAKFFGDLISGNYAWAISATLTFAGVGTIPPPVDATWLLRANVALNPDEPAQGDPRPFGDDAQSRG
jgi:hypothetical protein